MAIDSLQTKIKKINSPLMVDLSISQTHVPAFLMEELGNQSDAITAFGQQLLNGLKGEAAAIRFRLLPFMLLGQNGFSALSGLLKAANTAGFYTLLDASGAVTVSDAEETARKLFGEDGILPCDGVQISCFPGTDLIKPFLPYCESSKKDLFVTVRTLNKSSSEIQDLLAGSRTVHMAAVDYVNRFGGNTVGKYGFSRIGIATSAASGDSIRMVRMKYPHLFALIDGVEYPGANAKNCAQGFNNLGHGAIVCAGESVLNAWKADGIDPHQYVEAAVTEVKKLHKKLERYITIL